MGCLIIHELLMSLRVLTGKQWPSKSTVLAIVFESKSHEKSALMQFLLTHMVELKNVSIGTQAD